LQGWAAMLHALFDWLPRDMDQQSCAGIPDSHPSQKDAKDKAPTLLLMPAKNQKPGQSACDQPACASIPVPALRKEREERGTHFIADASENQKPGPPADLQACSKIP
jgi:hypothetical protein